MPSFTSVRMWLGTTSSYNVTAYDDSIVNYSITAVDDALNTITVSGDHTGTFVAGYVFRIQNATTDFAQLNAWQTVVSSTYTGGNTVVTLTLDITAPVAAGNKGICYITGTMTIAGDHHLAFPAGTHAFYTTGTQDYQTPINTDFQNGYIKITGSVYGGGNTVITCSPGFALYANSPNGAAGTKGTIGVKPLVDLGSFVELLPAYNTPGAVFQSRTGMKLRVVPANSTDVKRFVHTFQLKMTMNDMDVIARDGNRLNQWLYNYCLELHSELTFFVEYHGKNPSGVQYTEKQAYKGYLEDVPGWLYGDKWAKADGARDIILTFTCTGDGVYTDWEDFTSTTYRPRV